MKSVWRTWILLVSLSAAGYASDPEDGSPLVRGFADFQTSLPHDEPNLGLCPLFANLSTPQGIACSDYARYAWSGYVEIQPARHGILRHFFAFARPKLFAGDNIPGVRYTASAAPILWELSDGAGYQLPDHFELRYTMHKAWLLNTWDGARLRPDGPYGQNTTLGVRWNFGAWRQGPGAIARGYVDFATALPHGEIDLGLCGPAAGSACADYARYAIGGYTELRLISHGPARHSFVFAEPRFYAGNNVPQRHYTADATPILWELSWGAGYDLPLHLQLRFTRHDAIPLGRYGGSGSVSTYLSDGPYGDYATFGVQWNFGGWSGAAGTR